jgi:hypothetical protein
VSGRKGRAGTPSPERAFDIVSEEAERLRFKAATLRATVGLWKPVAPIVAERSRQALEEAADLDERADALDLVLGYAKVAHDLANGGKP